MCYVIIEYDPTFDNVWVTFEKNMFHALRFDTEEEALAYGKENCAFEWVVVELV